MPSDEVINNIVDEYDTSLGYHPSIVPLDIRLGLTNKSPQVDNTQSTKALRWGILGCSKVAHDFTQALKFLSSNNLPHEVIAIGSRDIHRASQFATLHSIPSAYGSYEELCHDTNIDIIYIASLHPYHKTHAELALRNDKHVLIEKPICMTSNDATYIYNLGMELNKFVGEGMWTRFFPVVEWTRCHLDLDVEANSNNDSATSVAERSSSTNNAIVPIGQVRVVQADFSIDGDDVGPYPTDSLYAKELGGGISWCVLPYVVAASTMPFDTPPDRIAANGIISEDDDDVGALAMGMTLTFNNTNNSNNSDRSSSSSPPTHKSIASGVCSYLAESSEITMYAAKHGRITIHGPAHCPTSATLIRKSAGRGNGATTSGDTAAAGVETANTNNSNSSITTTVTFPLPQSTPEIEASGGIKLPNSMGFIYEAEAVRRLICAGELSFPQWTPKESVECIRIIEEMIRQVSE